MRTFDAAIHNRIAQHPDVQPFICTDGTPLFDLSILVAHPDTFVLLVNETQDAAMVFQHWGGASWEMHTMMLPSCRGRRAIATGKAFIREMFEDHGAVHIWGVTARHNKRARLFFRWCGAQSLGFIHHDTIGEAEQFYNVRDDWLREHSA